MSARTKQSIVHIGCGDAQNTLKVYNSKPQYTKCYLFETDISKLESIKANISKLQPTKKKQVYLVCDPAEADLSRTTTFFEDYSSNDLFVVYKPDDEIVDKKNTQIIFMKLIYALQSYRVGRQKTIFLDTTLKVLTYLNLNDSKTIKPELQFTTAKPIIEMLLSKPPRFGTELFDKRMCFDYVESKEFFKRLGDEKLVVKEDTDLISEFKTTQIRNLASYAQTIFYFENNNRKPKTKKDLTNITLRVINQVEEDEIHSFYDYVCGLYPDACVFNYETRTRRGENRNKCYIVSELKSDELQLSTIVQVPSITDFKFYTWPTLEINHSLACEIIRNQHDLKRCPKDVYKVYENIIDYFDDTKETTDEQQNVINFCRSSMGNLKRSWQVKTPQMLIDFDVMVSLYYNSFIDLETIEFIVLKDQTHYFETNHANAVFMYRWLYKQFPTSSELLNFYVTCLHNIPEGWIWLQKKLKTAIASINERKDKKNKLLLSDLMNAFYYGSLVIAVENNDDAQNPFDQNSNYVVSDYPLAIANARQTDWETILKQYKVACTVLSEKGKRVTPYNVLQLYSKASELNSEIQEQILQNLEYNINFRTKPIKQVKPKYVLSIAYDKAFPDTETTPVANKPARKEEVKPNPSMDESLKHLLNVVVDKGFFSEQELGFALALSQFSLLLDVCERKKLLSTKAIAEFRT